MPRFLPFLLSVVALQSQTPPTSPEQPPQAVDEALRARVTKFYDDHVSRKYRLAEEFITEESKDDYYVLSKPEILAFKIGTIEYSEKFTKAKVTIIGKMPFPMPMTATRYMDMPFASYWKIENGLWCWYFNREAARHTPFGDVKDPVGDNVRRDATSLPAGPRVTIAELQSGVKIEQTNIDVVVGKPHSVKLVNTLPGPVSLSINYALMPISKTGIAAEFDKKDLKGNESSILTIGADPRMHDGNYTLRITVSPTHQIIDLTVHISH